jgi:hypothetical protein
MKKIYILAMLAVLLAVTSVSAQVLPYRPTCIDPATITNKPWKVTDYWPDSTSFSHEMAESPGTHGAYNICYQDNSIVFFRYDWGVLGGKFWRDPEDIYATNIQSISASFKGRLGFIVTFDYYVPFDGSICYQQDPSYGSWLHGGDYATNGLYINNPSYADIPTNWEPLDIIYQLKQPTETTCGEWKHFEKTIYELGYDTRFLGGSDQLASVGFQFANVYVRNVTLSNMQNKQVFKVY